MIRRAALIVLFASIVGRVGASDNLSACPTFPATIPDGDTPALIEAIACANATPDDDIITLTANSIYLLTTVNNTSTDTFPPPYDSLAVGANGLPSIVAASTAGTLTIEGANGRILRGTGSPNFRHFYIRTGGDLTLNDLSLGVGRGEYFGGAVVNFGSFTANRVSFVGNQIAFSAAIPVSVGGALVNFSTASISDSLFSSNSATQGAGIANGNSNAAAAQITVNGSTFLANNGTQGAGIHNAFGCIATIEGSIFSSNNTDAGSGSALFNSGGTMQVASSTIDGNRTNTSNGTGVRGGAIFTSSGTLNIVNSTISTNTANGQSGAGLHVQGGTVTVRHSTIVNNSASVAGGGIGSTLINTYSITLENTLIAGNSAPISPDISARITSNGYNLIADASGAIITGAATGDLYNADATPLNLDVLNDNGGAGFTHMLLAGSVAIDAGDPAFATPPDFDQRGNSFPRVLGRRLDIGAVESPSARLTITLALQGRSNPVPHPSYGIIVHTELRSTAGVARVIEDHVASMGGQVILNDVPTGGDLILWVKGTHTLARVQAVTLTEGDNSVTTMPLKEGDANDDNVVNITDFSILAATFGKTLGGGYDARADFNHDNAVNITDFSLLAASFGQIGAP